MVNQPGERASVVTRHRRDVTYSGSTSRARAQTYPIIVLLTFQDSLHVAVKVKRPLVQRAGGESYFTSHFKVIHGHNSDRTQTQSDVCAGVELLYYFLSFPPLLFFCCRFDVYFPELASATCRIMNELYQVLKIFFSEWKSNTKHEAYVNK